MKRANDKLKVSMMNVIILYIETYICRYHGRNESIISPFLSKELVEFLHNIICGLNNRCRRHSEYAVHRENNRVITFMSKVAGAG